ncbi:uncharacterized protein BDZ99DRAFT_543330 [Mytilinidion resinicola]|uniref:Spindle pole body component n=1 Tax=Mytilinidion resinicola TaxID=574789 RepID=A0A6A6Z6B1_9PEZI|nr:uncharacterized protein BDZ99DRAFT_543330 [Mytilinidion resinicola]KAF2816642.1 hypothetical protein BDZ99DRAFT_543330 [Mytilinidion resinicola]
MPQPAQIGALTDELVASITNFSPSTNAQAFKHAKDLAARGLRGYQYGRTNQFDVRAKLDGFDEKFRVLNRDDLANALLERLKELDKVSTKWTPETLSLLLQLSDRPVEKSNVDDLELLKPPQSPSPLTWAEIIADDPLDEEGIWESIDYAAESSEDEKDYRKREKARASEPTPSSSFTEEDSHLDPESYVIPIQKDALLDIRKEQFWRHPAEHQAGGALAEGNHAAKKSASEITELQMIREVLFMLAGLPTTLYTIDTNLREFKINTVFTLGHVVSLTLDDLLSDLGGIGTQIYRLRKWTGNNPPIPLFQTFEAAVMKRLAQFDSSLAGLQSRYLNPEVPVSVSLLELHNEVRGFAGPILQLATLVVAVMPTLSENPFLYLEALFERTSLAQMMSDVGLFQFFARIFLDCLQPYLKPIRIWMEHGELGPDNETFFVFMNDKSSEAASLWHDRYAIRRHLNGELHAPNFLHPAALRIFNTGKSIVFLKELANHHKYTNIAQDEPRLDFETICGEAESLPFAPFSELFGSAFEAWIGSKFSLASTVLRQKLSSECGLWEVLDTFRIVYLGADGSLLQDFADLVFERMDELDSNWNDRYLLTELVHGIYGAVLAPGQAERLVIRRSTTKHRGRSVKGLSAVVVDYNIPWSIANIIQKSSLQIYQRAFGFLLKVYRAKYLLQKVSWNDIQGLGDDSLSRLGLKMRHRLIWSTDVLRTYLTETVFASSTSQMEEALSAADDIDAMAGIHTSYITRLQDLCLLSKNFSPIYQAIMSLLDLVVDFADAHSRRPNASASLAKVQTSQQKRDARRRKLRDRRRSIIPTRQNSSDDGSEDEYDGDAESSTSHDAATSESLYKIQEQFDRLVPFVVAGLKGVSRAGGESAWEMLAERLDWNFKVRCS